MAIDLNLLCSTDHIKLMNIRNNIHSYFHHNYKKDQNTGKELREQIMEGE